VRSHIKRKRYGFIGGVNHEYLVGARAEKVCYFSPFKRENIRRFVSAEISSEPSDRSRSFASTERGILIGEKKMSILDINGEGDYVNFLAESISSKRARAREKNVAPPGASILPSS